MARYVSLLRGINVNGQRLIKMKDLKEMYKALGFTNVETYLQSGNVVFNSKIKSKEKISFRISEAIHQQFGYNVPVEVLRSDELISLFNENPFLHEKDTKMELCHVTILNKPSLIKDEKLVQLKMAEGEQYVIKKNIVYLMCPHGYGKTKLNNTFFEKLFGCCATTRNWKTISALSKMLKE